MKTLDLPVPALASAESRIEALEALGGQFSAAIERLVDSMLEMKTEHIDTLRKRLEEAEQQLALERTNRDLALTSRTYPKERTVIFVGTTYFGCNVKYAWLQALREADGLGIKVWFLPFDARQEQVVSELGAACLPADHTLWTPEHLRLVLSAAVVVVTDHFLHPNPFARALLDGARQVQLWHGVSIKEIGLRNLPGGRALGPQLGRVLATCGPFAHMIGTAQGAEDEWRRWFAFDRYTACGYPRNDILTRQAEARDLVGCDRDTYERARIARMQGRRVFLYAPTFRDGRPGWVVNAGLDLLAQAVSRRGDLLIVNLHPVESPCIPKLAPHFPQVAFVAPRTDIYPLLAQTTALITDYSSVMFDYLHLDRPLVFFRPDHEAYSTQSRQLFDAKLDVLPGPLHLEAQSLAATVSRDDLGQQPEHRQTRQSLLARWFDHADGASASRVLAVVAAEVDRSVQASTNRAWAASRFAVTGSA